MLDASVRRCRVARLCVASLRPAGPGVEGESVGGPMFRLASVGWGSVGAQALVAGRLQVRGSTDAVRLSLWASVFGDAVCTALPRVCPHGRHYTRVLGG